MRSPEAENLHNNWRKSQVIFAEKFCGIQTEKNPLDAWIYQEIIWDTKPDLIIECGSLEGGSALYLATILDAIGNGEVISIEKAKQIDIKHPRIKFIKGNSLEVDIKPEGRIMVILDSNHEGEHVLAELRKYAPLVSIGCYLIVEDTFWIPDNNKGPMWAIEQFLKENNNFEIDKSREKWELTYNENGYLLRK